MLRLAEKAFRPRPLPVPAAAHRHRAQLPRSHRLSRRPRRRARRAAHRADPRRLDRERHACALSVRTSCATRTRASRCSTRSRSSASTRCIGGARRDEEKARAKERIFSFRDEFGQWDPKNQRPELWSLYNARVHRGEHMRVFPISNWTELDVWQYIAREKLALPRSTTRTTRPVVRRSGVLVPVSPLVHAEARRRDRRREAACAFAPSATSPARRRSSRTRRRSSRSSRRPRSTRITERGATRMDDQTSEAAMELRKKEGYF